MPVHVITLLTALCPCVNIIMITQLSIQVNFFTTSQTKIQTSVSFSYESLGVLYHTPLYMLSVLL
jgi:hypothetical protein